MTRWPQKRLGVQRKWYAWAPNFCATAYSRKKTANCGYIMFYVQFRVHSWYCWQNQKGLKFDGSADDFSSFLILKLKILRCFFCFDNSPTVSTPSQTPDCSPAPNVYLSSLACQGAHDKSRATEERCDAKVSCTVLEQRWGQRCPRRL